MRKFILFLSALSFILVSMNACRSGHGGGCDAYGGSVQQPVKQVAKSL